MWIRPVFTIIPLNSLLIPQIGKFGIISDTRPCEIDDLAVSSRQRIKRAIDRRASIACAVDHRRSITHVAFLKEL